MIEYLSDKVLLITGGTGSFGKALTSYLLNKSNLKKIIIFSRDELKQFEMKNVFLNNSRLRFFIGDIRDKDRLLRAFHKVDYVVHAAALKQVDTGEYNPREFILTNVMGSQNVIDAAIDSGVKKVIALSTDKASSPINLYGATKLTADKLFISANVYGFNKNCKFGVVRYGNVMGSRGSVIPLFKQLVEKNQELPITDIRMTRFWISLNQAVEFVLQSLVDLNGGELFIPRIPSVLMMDLVKAMSQEPKIKEIGIRPGEKLHEEMLSENESRNAVRQKNRFILSPSHPEWEYFEPPGDKLPEGFTYNSKTNDQRLTISEIKKLIDKNI